ncbi:MAG: metallophosphoesterase, partial [Clostridia bacterium]|nr:metallophosphoesterase [Clostridia bacterium]
MIKLIHTADLHLDSPFSMLDLQKSEIRRQEMRDSFEALINLVYTTRSDMLLIAGDLFESSLVTHETLNMVKNGFARIPDCHIIIAPGNHDPAGENGIYGKIDFS